jgi:transposase
MRILAIDLGKFNSLFCWFDEKERKYIFRKAPSRPQAFHDLLVKREVDRVVIEVCDMAGWVKDLCEALSIPIQVVNPNGEGWRWRNVKKKTDKEDAKKLCRLSLSGDVKEVWLPQRIERHWKSLILYRHKLVERRTAIGNSIHALLVCEGKAMKGGRGCWTGESMEALRAMAKPIGECQKEDCWRCHLGMELESLEQVSKRIAELDKKLNEMGEKDERVRLLKTIPGVGPRLAELAVATIGEAKRFKSARQVSAYGGLVPRRYQSGEMDRSGRISKAGCGKLRKVLTEVSWGMLEHNERGREVFMRISKGQKTRRKQAAVALARRVLTWCWAMLRDGRAWEGKSERGLGPRTPAPDPTGKPPACRSRRENPVESESENGLPVLEG